MTSLVTGADAALSVRYTPEALRVLDADERARFLDDAGRPRHPSELPWELLYRIEPGLYGRLVAGERLHEGILEWLPAQCGRVLEIGAGTGRLTVELAPRCRELLAVEPAAGLRDILARRLHAAGMGNVRIARGFFDALPGEVAAHDMVICCSAFTPATLEHPERCLQAMEDRCVPGGLVVVVWPSDVAWLQAHGFEHVAFEGPMTVEFATVEEALDLARIFYPHALAELARRGSRLVDFATLGMPAPRGLCWRRRA